MPAIGIDDLREAAGRDLGCTGWRTVEHSQLVRFAAATGTPAPVPGGAAPPLFVLALTNLFLPELLVVSDAANGVNYGAGEVRFPASVKAGDRLRACARILDAAEVAGGMQTTIEIRVEVEGGSEPACVVQSLSRWSR
jgi:acyl dehydratase